MTGPRLWIIVPHSALDAARSAIETATQEGWLMWMGTECATNNTYDVYAVLDRTPDRVIKDLGDTRGVP